MSEMDSLEIKIFDSPEEDVVIPGDNEEKTQGDKVISDGLEDAISGDTVKSVIIPEENGLIQPNYVIDMSELEEVEPIQTDGLDALVSKDGDMAVYIYLNGGIQKIGMAKSWKLHRIIAPAINNLFNGKCKIYRDYKIGEQAEVVDSKDISHLRLNI